ncbi:MAG: hypothetical protein NC089_09845 [Bacteroides sp.]|nr:hypothetical protein [Bacteroides sp.]MCM1549135.1 hypothetical protein [Clostridium sp.]
MEEKKTIFDYIGQVFLIFGITIGILNIFCLLFGDSAKEISTLFSLGSQGLSILTTFQFFLVSACIVIVKFIFFTDCCIKKMSIAMRTVCMITVVLIIIAVFVWVCGWFPVNMWKPWLMFFLCFGISFGISMAVTMVKERLENRKMEEALHRLKQETQES